MADKQIQRFATVTLANGEKKRISARGKTEREALTKLAKIKAEYDAGIRTINNNTPFAKWYEEWMVTYKKPKVKIAHYEVINSIFKTYFLPVLGNIEISKIKPINVQKAMNTMQGKSKSYCRNAKAMLKDCFKTAKRNGIILTNPAEDITMPEIKSTEKRRALTEAERELFIQTAQKHKHGLLFGITYACGLRPGEVRALTWEDIDFKEQRVKVNKAAEVRTRNIKEPKTPAGIRTVPIPNWYMNMLRKEPIPIKKDTLIFTNQNKKMVTETNYKTYWHTFLHAMDVQNGAETYYRRILKETIDHSITPYYLRHDFATRCAELNIPLKVTQKWMGHEKPTMTLEFYQHASDKMEKEAEQKYRVS